MTGLDHGAVQALIDGRHGDPFAVLGPHGAPDAPLVRTLQPGADAVDLIGADGAVLGGMARVHDAGLFEGTFDGPGPYRLRVYTHGISFEAEDAYRFGPTLGPLDLHLMAEGRHRDLALCLGAHPARYDGVEGVRFAVWAPNASRVSVIGEFNLWDARRNPMRKHMGAGVWEMFVPGVMPGAIYKYDLLGPHGEALPQKADPLAWAAERAPATGSIVVADTPFRWTDAAWMERRGGRAGGGRADQRV